MAASRGGAASRAWENRMSTELRIAIIGGGIGGLAVAAALRSSGHEIALYEQAEQFREIGAGMTIHPNATRLLDKMGFGGALRRIGSPTAGIRLLSMNGEPITAGRPANLPPLSEAGQGYNVHRAELLEILVDALPSSGIHLNHRCVDVTERDDDIELTFENGASAKFDLVIGADGNRSVVRRRIGFDVTATSEGMMAYRGLIPADRLAWAKELQGLVNWIGPGRSFLCYPVSAGAVINVVAFVRTDRQATESWRELGDVSALAAEYVGWDERVGQTIVALDETYVWGIYDRPSLERWSTRRATLLGDAAHAMVPHLGQGAGQAIEDAFTLGALLKDANKSDVASLLNAYEDLRKDRTTRIQKIAREGGQFYRQTYESLEQREEALLAFAKNVRWVMEYDAEAAITSRVGRNR